MVIFNSNKTCFNRHRSILLQTRMVERSWIWKVGYFFRSKNKQEDSRHCAFSFSCASQSPIMLSRTTTKMQFHFIKRSLKQMMMRWVVSEKQEVTLQQCEQICQPLWLTVGLTAALRISKKLLNINYYFILKMK